MFNNINLEEETEIDIAKRLKELSFLHRPDKCISNSI